MSITVNQDALEQQLLQEVQQGNRSAYDDLQHLLEPDIRRYVRRRISDVYTVDDIVQEIFLAFYQHIDRIQPVANLRPYLFRIARNKCYDDLRQVQRHEEDESLDDDSVHVRVSFTEANQQPKPDDLTHWVLLHLEVQEAIEQLPASQRETLMLYSEEQMSYAEIAEIMDVSIGTVKSRLFYAKKNLRGFLRSETLGVLDTEFQASPKPKKNALTQSTPELALTEDD